MREQNIVAETLMPLVFPCLCGQAVLVKETFSAFKKQEMFLTFLQNTFLASANGETFYVMFPQQLMLAGLRGP